MKAIQKKEQPAKALLQSDKVNPYGVIHSYVLEVYPTLRLNKATLDIELDGQPVTEAQLNSMYIRLTAEAPDGDKVNILHWQLYLNSSYLTAYNPLADYFAAFEGKEPEYGQINALVASLRLDPSQGMMPKLAKALITKWLIGVVAGVFDNNYNPIFFILVGSKGCGKTEFFRRLLPDELRAYLAESKLDAGKDDAALACENLLLLVDEMDFLTKREASELRRFISQNFFSYRPPYAKKNIKRKRLASFCGTSNEMQVINDPANNRRIIPIAITGVDYAAYNAINKDALWHEVYDLFTAGLDDWHLTKKEIAALDEATRINAVTSPEDDLLVKYYTRDDSAFITSTDIIKRLSWSQGVRLNSVAMGRALASRGFSRVKKKVNGVATYGWNAKHITDTEDDDL